MRGYLPRLAPTVGCVMALSLFARATFSQDLPSCEIAYSEAEGAFFDSRFDETIRLLRPCAASEDAGMPAKIYRLLGMAYMNQGDNDQARQTITRLLLARPDYEPDLVQDPPSYTVLVLGIREQLQREERLPTSEGATETSAPSRKRGAWLGVGLGLVVIGLTAVLAGS